MADITLDTQRLDGPTETTGRRARTEFRLLFLVTLAFFLIEAAVSSLLPRSWRRARSRDIGLRSIVAEAREAADMSFPLSFIR